MQLLTWNPNAVIVAESEYKRALVQLPLSLCTITEFTEAVATKFAWLFFAVLLQGIVLKNHILNQDLYYDSCYMPKTRPNNWVLGTLGGRYLVEV